MKKLDSSFKNMVFSLGGIAIVAGLALGFVYKVTANPIAKANLNKEVNAVSLVLPEFNNDPVKEQFKISVNGDSLICFPAKKDGKSIGFAVETFSDKGYGGMMTLMVGFTQDGKIYDYSTIELNETPGLGAKTVDWFKKQMKGFDPAKQKLSVTKDGGDVDAITAATISSRAFCDAVSKAYEAYKINNADKK